MTNQLILTKNDLILIIEHHLGNLHPLDLIGIVNQFTNSWVGILPDTGNFVWNGGSRPDYLASVIESDKLQKEMAIDNHS